ncbi:hypothetical protein [Acinetobacter variabilis]|uniref:hypothetical protein n=1 Tax=Acinetobacter variabilis TaxID=70346 RepID=UPI002899F8E6|nr:hypothetical protein [Acinetobacter variabilis]
MKNTNIEAEYELFVEEFNQELNTLLKSCEGNAFFESSHIHNLDRLLDFSTIDLNLFYANKEILFNFLNNIKIYNESGEEELIPSLNKQAGKVFSIIVEHDDSHSSIADDKILKDKDKIKNEIKRIKEEQEEISSRNQEILERQTTAIRIINELKDKNNAYSQLIDEDSNTRILKLYNDIYNREIVIADKYRNWALGIFAFIGVLLILGFLNLSIQNWNYLRDSSYIYIPFGWDSLIKTLMLFSLSTPAWYLARESSKHRKVAYKARMLGTELAAFPLYAREFKDEDRLELRKILADRFFGQELYSDSKTASNSDNSLEQVKLLTEVNKVLAESLKMKKSVESS